MRVDLALLGDYALVDKMEKLTVAGIFRSVAGTVFPFTRSVMFLVLVLVAERDDGDHHSVMVRLIDPDGRDVIPELRAELEVQREDPLTEKQLNIILELNAVTFNVPGTHCFDVFVDERFTERVPLEVMLAHLTEAGPPAGQ